MLETFEAWDRALFLWLNSFHSPFFDQIMLFLSGKKEWIPLYAILLVLLIIKYKKHVWLPLLGVGLTITLADQTSVQLFKEVFERYRPCWNHEISDLVHIVNDKCGGRFGFVSSHATNSFSLATLLGLLLSKQGSKKMLYFLLFWATLISYSRIYLGVHYPSDVLGGAILGVLIALLVFRIINTIFIHKFSHA